MTKKSNPDNSKPKRFPVAKGKVKPKKHKHKKFVNAVVDAATNFDNQAYTKDGNMGKDLLRIMAGQYYASNLNQCSIREMEKHPIFKTVHGSLENWSRRDRWIERRMEFQETIRFRVQKVLVSEVVQIQMDQLKNLQELFDSLFKKVLKGVGKLNVETASLPALISAVVKLAELLHEWRLSLGEMVAPKMAFDGKETATQIPVKPDLSFEETRAAAKYLIKLRREQMRHNVKKDVQEDYTEDIQDFTETKSKSEVVEGK